MKLTLRPVGRGNRPITHRRLLQLLDYDPQTGTFTWRERGAAEFKDVRAHRAWNGRYAGKIAGSIDTSGGYARIGVDGLEYWAHRLAWFYVKKRWPRHDIDHRDRDRANNRFSNLRQATRAENLQNQVDALPSSRSGVRGVYWDEARGKWKVELSVANRNKLIGRFDDLQAAITARAVARAKFHPGALP